MDSAIYAIVTLCLALVIYGAFAGLRRATRTSTRDELERVRNDERRLGTRAYSTDDDPDSPPPLRADPLPSHTEAMILPLGAPMERSFATFEGPLSDVRTRVAALSVEDRRHIAIWTPGHVFTAEGLLAEPPGHEHDPLPPETPGSMAGPATGA